MADERPIHLSVTLPSGSVLLPAWLVACFMLCFVFATLAMLLLWNIGGQTVREIRSLQLHVQDVENVLIRNKLADRKDMADWGPGEASAKTKGR